MGSGEMNLVSAIIWFGFAIAATLILVLY